MVRSQEIAELRLKVFGGRANERMGWVKESLGPGRRHII